MKPPRLPSQGHSNPWAASLAARRRSGASLLDLTDADASHLRDGLDGAPRQQLGASHIPDPRGAAASRAAIARYYGDRGATVVPDDLLLTASTSEAYAHLFRLLGEPGAQFATPRPSYPLFEPIAQVEAVQVDTWRLAYDGAWHFDPASLPKHDPAGVIIVQPNHPTGTWLAPGELAQVEDWCARTGAVLIVDEVFSDYPWKDSVPGAGTILATERRVPTVVLSGLSKVCGLPQLKLSWMVVAGPEPEKRQLLEGLEWIADLFLSVNGPVQQALPELLANRHPFQAAVRERIHTNLARLDRAVAAQPAMSRLTAAGGWVVILRVPRVRTEEEWALELLRRGVVTHPGHFYDMEDEAHLVVSLIVEPDVFSAGLDVIEGLVAEA